MAFERILVVEDDREIAELLAHYLKREGYRVHLASEGKTALQLISQHAFDLILLDIMLPGMDGFDVLREMRKQLDVPVLFVSARGDEPDKIIGLGLGADDYITKPFTPGELLARVRAHIRRYQELKGTGPEQEEGVLDFRELVIDTRSRQVFLENREISLTRTEFDILALLASSPGRVYTFERIYEGVWNEEYLGDNNTIMVHIRAIRQKLGDNPRSPRFVQTVWGVGYKFIG